MIQNKTNLNSTKAMSNASHNVLLYIVICQGLYLSLTITDKVLLNSSNVKDQVSITIVL